MEDSSSYDPDISDYKDIVREYNQVAQKWMISRGGSIMPSLDPETAKEQSSRFARINESMDGFIESAEFFRKIDLKWKSDCEDKWRRNLVEMGMKKLKQELYNFDDVMSKSVDVEFLDQFEKQVDVMHEIGAIFSGKLFLEKDTMVKALTEEDTREAFDLFLGQQGMHMRILSFAGNNNVKLVLRKILTATDVKPYSGAFAIREEKKVFDKFLSQEEKEMANSAGGMQVPIILDFRFGKEPMQMITIKKWVLGKRKRTSKKKGGDEKTYVLTSQWNEVVSTYPLQKHDDIELWVFRKDERLHLALIKSGSNPSPQDFLTCSVCSSSD